MRRGGLAKVPGCGVVEVGAGPLFLGETERFARELREAGHAPATEEAIARVEGSGAGPDGTAPGTTFRVVKNLPDAATKVVSLGGLRAGPAKSCAEGSGAGSTVKEINGTRSNALFVEPL